MICFPDINKVDLDSARIERRSDHSSEGILAVDHRAYRVRHNGMTIDDEAVDAVGDHGYALTEKDRQLDEAAIVNAQAFT